LAIKKRSMFYVVPENGRYTIAVLLRPPERFKSEHKTLKEAENARDHWNRKLEMVEDLT